MESIKSKNDFDSLVSNKVIGDPELENSVINFYGVNNILFCDGDVKLSNAHLNFLGNNSIIYLSYTNYEKYSIDVYVRSDSTIFIGKNTQIGNNVSFNIQESQNLIIGEDCLIGNEVVFRTFDAYSIYDNASKERINLSSSIFIGDHVWIDHFSYISRGVKIGSGAIVGIHSVVIPMDIVYSNDYVMGNPAQVIDNKVFFTKEFTGAYKPKDTEASLYYDSDVFIYNFANNETLDMDNLDKILKDLNIDDRFDFIQKLFVRNKRKNRFAIL